MQPTLESVQRTLLHALALLKHACAFVAERTGTPCPLLVVFSEASPWYKEVRPLLERVSYVSTNAQIDFFNAC